MKFPLFSIVSLFVLFFPIVWCQRLTVRSFILSIGRKRKILTEEKLICLKKTLLWNIFQKEVEEAEISGNLDAPEGGFDAVLQALTCNVRKVFLFCFSYWYVIKLTWGILEFIVRENLLTVVHLTYILAFRIAFFQNTK